MSQVDLGSQISQIIQARQQQLPACRNRLERLQAMRGLVDATRETLDGLTAVDSSPLDRLRLEAAGVCKSLDEAIHSTEVVRDRIARTTLNIGVSGQARMGKSQLLQSISGLTDEQIPTGPTVPVTAVRSRICNVPGVRRAVLALHTFKTFRDECLHPYHQALGVGELPYSLEEFRRKRYQQPDEKDLEKRVMYNRLLGMQRAVDSYEGFLTGEERHESLDGLRSWVAYPASSDEGSDRVARRYLAVRDARIECEFPLSQVSQLMLVDLPGLGEVAPEAEGHHIASLRHEVDLLLLVKRCTPGNAYWSEKDQRAVSVIDKVRGVIEPRRDFVFLLVNTDPSGKELLADLLSHINTSVNEGENGRHLLVLHADVKNPAEVATQILDPILSHLARRLPEMDAMVQQESNRAFSAAQSAVAEWTRQVNELAREHFGGPIPDTAQRADELHRDLGAALHDLEQELLQAARQRDVSNKPFEQSIETCHQQLREWLDRSVGTPQWRTVALRSIKRDKSSAGFANDEVNRLRVEISRRYGVLDQVLQEGIRDIQDRVSDCLSSCLGAIDGVHSGREYLEVLHRRTLHPVPLPVLADALRHLLDTRIEYRSQLFPRLRRALDELVSQSTLPDGTVENRVPEVTLDESGLALLESRLISMARSGIHEMRKAAMDEAGFPILVRHAAVEHFADMFVRAGSAKTEFRMLIARNPSMKEQSEESEERRTQERWQAALGLTQQLGQV